MHVDFTGAGRDALDHAIAHGLVHLGPPFLAVRDYGCRFFIAAQSQMPFSVPKDRPAIVIIGDDLSQSLGPTGFHARSLKRFIERCGAVVIVSSAAQVETYAAATSNTAILRQDVAIIETQPRHEADWYNYVRSILPKVPVLISTTVGEGNA